MVTIHFGKLGRIVRKQTTVSLYPETVEKMKYHVISSDNTLLGYYESFKEAVKRIHEQ